VKAYPKILAFCQEARSKVAHLPNEGRRLKELNLIEAIAREWSLSPATRDALDALEQEN
jgi:hypothetical protein